MIRSSRRPYIANQVPEKAVLPEPAEIHSEKLADENALKTILVDSLKLLSKSLDEVKQSVKSIEEKLEYYDSRLRRLEGDIDRYNAKSRAAELDLLSTKNELEYLKREKSMPAYGMPANMDKPVMPGTGFAGVTPNYLRSLHQK